MASAESIPAILASFTLVGLAEIGDKSQLVCMALASRHRHWPVLGGAAAAFLLLNTLAVTLGAGVAAWIPEQTIAAVVALLFAAFGVHALFFQKIDESENVVKTSGHNIFLATFSMIFLAELGDKTQFAVAGLASNMATVPVWIGATAALVGVSALGVWVGHSILRGLPTIWLHRLGGTLFLVFAALAARHALSGV